MAIRIDERWKTALKGEFSNAYFIKLAEYVRKEYASQQCYPPASLIFNAFDSCPFDKVRVVILGQDPYHREGQAHGLSFSVPDGVRIPPSLLNIYKEIERSTGTPIPTSGNLERWATQGVLMINATLTVRAGMPTSHQGKGWERFTDSAITALSRDRSGIVFLLWGAYAIRKASLIDDSRHLVLTSPHPSPLSAHRGFIGNNHFVLTNEYLAAHGERSIVW